MTKLPFPASFQRAGGMQRFGQGRCRGAALCQLSKTLLGEIVAREHRGGALLSTEHKLSVRHRVGRSTVRQALRDLEIADLIVRLPGIGTRVVSQMPRTDYVLTGQAATNAMGYAAETRLVVRHRRDVMAGALLAARLGTSIGSRWRRLTGLLRVAHAFEQATEWHLHRLELAQ